MGKPNRWRCGRERAHFGEHGDWVSVDLYKKQKWRCGMTAQAPAAKRVIKPYPLYICPFEGCDYRHPDSGPARGHWYTHIKDRERNFNSVHGTEAGYQYHRKYLKEDACPECVMAHRVHNREWARQWRRGYGRGRGDIK